MWKGSVLPSLAVLPNVNFHWSWYHFLALLNGVCFAMADVAYYKVFGFIFKLMQKKKAERRRNGSKHIGAVKFIVRRYSCASWNHFIGRTLDNVKNAGAYLRFGSGLSSRPRLSQFFFFLLAFVWQLTVKMIIQKSKLRTPTERACTI